MKHNRWVRIYRRRLVRDAGDVDRNVARLWDAFTLASLASDGARIPRSMRNTVSTYRCEGGRWVFKGNHSMRRPDDF